MEPKQVLKNVRKIEIKTKRLVENLLQGAYHSVFKGRGIEFSESRQYQHGDDVRAIDWNLTARFNEPYIKEFIEERDLTIYVVFDISQSNEFGSERLKKDYAVELAASLMFAAMHNTDRVGLALFTTDVERFFQPRKGRRHVMRLIREMLYYEPKENGTNLKNSLAYLSKVIKKRSIIFIISDFMTPDFTQPLKILKNKHEIIALRLIDEREIKLPDVGLIELEDAETGAQILVDTSDEEFRKEYHGLVLEGNKKLSKMLRIAKTDLINFIVGQPFDIPLRKYFSMRQKRYR